MGTNRGPLEIIVAAWPEPDAAAAALAELRAAQKENLIGIVDVATLVVDADGTLRIRETKDMRGRQGAVVGGLVGAGVGLVTGGIGWLLLSGGALGALAARARDGGLPDERLKALGQRMTPSSSALVAVIERTVAADLQRAMAALGAEVVAEAVADEVAEQLGEGAAVAYSSAEVEDGVIVALTPAPRGPATESSPSRA
jgi:uncharacterized membrane protein